MGFAVGRGYIDINPFVGVNFTAAFTSPNETREKRPALVDAAAFGALLRKIDIYEGRNDNIVGYGLRLLALMFPRPGELAGAQWAHFDLDVARKWSVPFAELKQRTERKLNDKRVDEPFEVPLSRQAIALLRELHKLTGHCRFLLPGRGQSRTISENTLNVALKALGYDGQHCAHGFRSSASTLLNKERIDGRRRFERELIEVQLDHVDDSTRAIYDRDNLWLERAELMQFWADKIDQLKATNIAPIRAA
jgi:integrase